VGTRSREYLDRTSKYESDQHLLRYLTRKDITYLYHACQLFFLLQIVNRKFIFRTVQIMPPSDIRFFTEDWTITVPSLPNVKFLRLTPLRSDEQIKILSNPLNSPFASPSDLAEVWDEEMKKGVKERFMARYNLSKTKYQALEIVVEIDGETVGQGSVYEIPQVLAGLANIGLTLAASARGQGIGKAAMQVLLRLANELEVDQISCPCGYDVDQQADACTCKESGIHGKGRGAFDTRTGRGCRYFVREC